MCSTADYYACLTIEMYQIHAVCRNIFISYQLRIDSESFSGTFYVNHVCKANKVHLEHIQNTFKNPKSLQVMKLWNSS